MPSSSRLLLPKGPWGIGDPLRNHWPLYANIVTAWSKDIREGKATEEEPTVALAFTMKTAEHHRDKRKSAPANANAAVPTASPVAGWQPPSLPGYGGMPMPFPFFFNPGIDTVALFGQQRQQPRAEALRSSPSAQSVDEQELVEFFDWCEQRSEWQVGARPEDLRRMRELFIYEDYSLNGIKKLSEASWLARGLKGGQQDKIVSCIEKFKQIKRANR